MGLSLNESDVIVLFIFSVCFFIMVNLILLNAGVSKIASLLVSIVCVIVALLVYFGFSTKPRYPKKGFK
jgi:branched-subunit amino acid permease